MRIKIGILMLLGCTVFFSSCNNNKTYAEMKRDQKKAIDKFITERGIEVLKNYPSDGVFEDNQFVLLDNGVYLNVVDSGNGNRAIMYKTNILMRCSGEHIFKTDTGSFNLFTNGNSPIEFTYGYASSEMDRYSRIYLSTGNIYPTYVYLSTGIESILEYVGQNAIVKLIVPFEMGSSYQSSSSSFGYGSPIYYDRVRYQFYE